MSQMPLKPFTIIPKLSLLILLFSLTIARAQQSRWKQTQMRVQKKFIQSASHYQNNPIQQPRRLQSTITKQILTCDSYCLYLTCKNCSCSKNQCNFCLLSSGTQNCLFCDLEACTQCSEDCSCTVCQSAYPRICQNTFNQTCLKIKQKDNPSVAKSLPIKANQTKITTIKETAVQTTPSKTVLTKDPVIETSPKDPIKEPIKPTVKEPVKEIVQEKIKEKVQEPVKQPKQPVILVAVKEPTVSFSEKEPVETKGISETVVKEPITKVTSIKPQPAPSPVVDVVAPAVTPQLPKVSQVPAAPKQSHSHLNNYLLDAAKFEKAICNGTCKDEQCTECSCQSGYKCHICLIEDGLQVCTSCNSQFTCETCVDCACSSCDKDGKCSYYKDLSSYRCRYS